METHKSPQELFAALRSLNLPDGKYAVFGSGPMGIRGLHVINDVDVIVTPDLFAELEKAHGGSEDHEHGIRRIMLQGDAIEILNGWHPMIAPLEELIAEAEEIEGIKFVRLERVLAWKEKRRKSKDLGHIKTIRKFLGLPHEGEKAAGS